MKLRNTGGCCLRKGPCSAHLPGDGCWALGRAGLLSWGLLLRMARGMTSLIYSGNVKGKWNEEKAWCNISGQNAIIQQQKSDGAECCAQTSGVALLWQPSCRHTPRSPEPSPDVAPGTCAAGGCSGSSPLAPSPTSRYRPVPGGDPGLCHHPSVHRRK